MAFKSEPVIMVFESEPVTMIFENEPITIARTIQNNTISNGFLSLTTNPRDTQRNQSYNTDIITLNA